MHFKRGCHSRILVKNLSGVTTSFYVISLLNLLYQIDAVWFYLIQCFCKTSVFIAEKEEGLVAEVTEQQRKKWLELTENDIKRVIEQSQDEELYCFEISEDYKILYMHVSKEILNNQNVATIHSGLLMTLTYDSEIYQVLNGSEDWSLQIIVTDMETGKELENIKFPDEDYNLSIENWNNL